MGSSNITKVTSLQQFAEKTEVAIFNPLIKTDIMPQISLNGCVTNTEVVEQYKLLGQIITTNMKTLTNTRSICKKGYIVNRPL